MCMCGGIIEISLAAAILKVLTGRWKFQGVRLRIAKRAH